MSSADTESQESTTMMPEISSMETPATESQESTTMMPEISSMESTMMPLVSMAPRRRGLIVHKNTEGWRRLYGVLLFFSIVLFVIFFSMTMEVFFSKESSKKRDYQHKKSADSIRNIIIGMLLSFWGIAWFSYLLHKLPKEKPKSNNVSKKIIGEIIGIILGIVFFIIGIIWTIGAAMDNHPSGAFSSLLTGGSIALIIYCSLSIDVKRTEDNETFEH